MLHSVPDSITMAVVGAGSYELSMAHKRTVLGELARETIKALMHYTFHPDRGICHRWEYSAVKTWDSKRRGDTKFYAP